MSYPRDVIAQNTSSAPGRASLAAIALLVGLVAACGKEVPAPWNARGVPADGLSEVSGGSNENEFLATYSVEAHKLVPAFRDGLTRAGLVACGAPVVEGSGHHHAYFLEGQALWHLRVALVDDGESGVLLARMDPKKGWGNTFEESGCKAPGFSRP